MARRMRLGRWIVAGIGLALLWGCREEQRPPSQPADKKPRGGDAGEVTTILSANPAATGNKGEAAVEHRVGGKWQAQRVGQGVSHGEGLRTREGVRTRVALKDGTVLHLNERTEVQLAAARKLKVVSGEIFVEAAEVAGAPLSIETPAGSVRVTGTKLNVKADGDKTVVDVSRGSVEVSGAGSRVEVGAGERAVVKKGAAPRVSVSRDLALSTEWAREIRPPSPSVKAVSQPGFGSLTARVPGRGKSRSLTLASHEVRVVVQGNIARTEIEQRYHNSSGSTLEGTYRFPLPPGATISRLALYVGNRLEEGEIVERHRARQIFKKIVDDTIRPRDPALLEWVGGRTFQMKIFPIPPRSSRRVILAYTQPLSASYGRYQYVYPMATSRGKATRVGKFAVRMTVDHPRGVKRVDAPLYPVLTEKAEGGATTLRYEATGFVPAASFVANYTPAGEPPELQLALYEPKGQGRSGSCALSAVAPKGQPASRRCGDRGGFFAAVLRPELPTARQATRRDYLFLLDSSRSSGPRGWQTQRAVLEAFLAEMDLRARFNVLACDARCRKLGAGFVQPQAAARRAALSFVKGIQPGGSSDIQGAFAEAAKIAATGSRVHVVYVGDGRPTAGELREPQLASLVVDALGKAGATMSALAVGSDTAEMFLAEATRRLGGAVHAVHPGDDVVARVFDVVAAQYRPTLTDVEVTLEGLDAHSVYPRHLPSITAGSEVILVGRYGRGGSGTLHVRGRVGDKPFERRYPVRLAADAAEKRANTFIPRLWAQRHLDALSVDDYDGNRPEIVRVSKAYTVLSRATAFLVLENERMYREFRVKRKRQRTYWKGGKTAVRAGSDAPAKKGEDEAKAAGAVRKAKGLADATFGSGSGKGLGGLAGGAATRSPVTTAAPAPPAAAGPTEKAPAGEPRASSREEAPADEAADADEGLKGDVAGTESERTQQARRGRGRAAARSSRPAPMARRPMPRMPPRMKPQLKKRKAVDGLALGGGGGSSRPYRRRHYSWVWVDRSRIAPLLAVRPTASGQRSERRLKQQVAARPLVRSLRRRYQQTLVRNGNYDEALRHADKWAGVESNRHRAILALGDVQATLVGTGTAMRTYSASVEVRPWSARLHRALAAMYRNKGELRRACAHRWSLVSLSPKRVDRQLDLATCLAGAGERDGALKILTQLAASPAGRRQAARIGKVLAALQTGAGAPAAPKRRHALEVSATWNQPVDLDLVLITPRGERISALRPGRRGSVDDSHDGRRAEVLGLRWARNGRYRVEVVLGPSGRTKHPISGTVLVKAHGKSQVIPFVLDGRSRVLAQVTVNRRRERRLR